MVRSVGKDPCTLGTQDEEDWPKKPIPLFIYHSMTQTSHKEDGAVVFTGTSSVVSGAQIHEEWVKKRWSEEPPRRVTLRLWRDGFYEYIRRV